MTWRGPAMAGATVIVGGLLLWQCLSLRKRIRDVTMLIPVCNCAHGAPAKMPHHAGQAGGRVQTMNASTITNIQGLSGMQLAAQLMPEAEVQGVDPQMLAAAITPHQPTEPLSTEAVTEAPPAAEHEAEDVQSRSSSGEGNAEVYCRRQQRAPA